MRVIAIMALTLGLTAGLGGCDADGSTAAVVDDADTQATDDAFKLPPKPTLLPPPIDYVPVERTKPPSLCTLDGCLYDESDDIYGVAVPREGSWWVHGGFIYHNKKRVVVRGLNWFGLETETNALHGLWTGRTIGSFLAQVKGLGFNALRVPSAPTTLDDSAPTADWAQAQGFHTGRAGYEELLRVSAEQDMYILMDLHRCDPNLHGDQTQGPTLCGDHTTEAWHDNLENLARLSLEHDHVMGIDLFNEPWGIPWGEWAIQAAGACEAVLRVNPRILCFIQGVAWKSSGYSYELMWGENLTHAGAFPVDIPKARRVYAPHVYGFSVFPLNYLLTPEFPDNLPMVWDLHFGYLLPRGETIIFGEFGGLYDDSVLPGSVTWQSEWVTYMRSRGFDSYFYWSLNPNSIDTGGILLDDWETPNLVKIDLLAPLLRDE